MNRPIRIRQRRSDALGDGRWRLSLVFTGRVAADYGLEDNFLITADGCEKLCSYPDDFRR